MSALVMVAQLILGLALLVFVHEAGHFSAARIFKIRVPKFYLFFNPGISIVRCKRVNGRWRVKFFAKNLADTEIEYDENGKPVLDDKGKPKRKLVDVDTLTDEDWRKYPQNTEYGIGWLPLGGYCQISGMIDETQTISNMPTEPQNWEYRSKPAWQRLIVILGGVIVNVIVGVLLFALVIGKYEKVYLPNDAITDGIYAYQSARDMGFRSGDKIVSIDGKTHERSNDVVRNPKIFFGAIVQVERDGKEMDIVVGEEAYHILKNKKDFIDISNFPVILDSMVKDGAAYSAGMQKGDRILSINDTFEVSSYGVLIENRHHFANQRVLVTYMRDDDTSSVEMLLDSNGRFGIFPFMPYQSKPYTFSQTIKYGWVDAMNSLLLNIKGLGKIISGKENARESLSGPIGIAQIYGSVWNWGRFWYITGLLSIILAFMNVLPIPGLDGGHAIFALVEMLTGKKVSDKVLQSAQTIGMIILLLLMAFIIGNDIFKLFM